MKTANKLLLLSLLSAACIHFGCSEENATFNVNDEQPQNPDTPDVPGTPDECMNDCEKDAKRCTSSGVMICQKGETGCLDWVLKTPCEAGMHCDESTFTCEEGCAETCPIENQTRCNDSVIESCSSDEKGCAVWETVEECEDICNPQTVACEEICHSTCEAGAKMCDGNGIAECVDEDGDGCFEWGARVACPDKQHCDETTISCTLNCKSECENGKIQAFATSSKKCMDSNDDGCFEWVDDIKCDAGKKYDAATNACTPACGNDCEPFSIVLLPDTQYYTRTYPDVAKGNEAPKLRKQIKWINDNQKSRNIKAVITLGDITDTNHPDSYKYNDTIFKTLDSKIAWILSGGNHDYLNGKCNDGGSTTACSYDMLRYDGYSFSRSDTKFSKYINADTYKGKSWFGGFYYGSSSYITFTAANTEFIVISLEFAPRKAVMCWAENIIKSHPNAKVILETHSYLSNTSYNSVRKNFKYSDGRSGRVIDNDKYYINFFNSGSGKDVYNDLASRFNNVILVASGHTLGSSFRMSKANGNNWLAEILVDYQSENTGNNNCTDSFSSVSDHGSGGGWLRVLTFDPQKLTISAETISATGEKKFICPTKDPKYYPASPTETPGFTLDPNDDAKAATNKHKFVANFDFITPVDFKDTGAKTGYLNRTVNAISSGNQITPAVAMKRDSGEHVIVWADDAYDNNQTDLDGEGNMDIRARVLCEYGCDLSPDQFTVNTKAGNQTNPDVAMDINGNFVVTWTNHGNTSVYMRQFDMTGNVLNNADSEIKVNTSGNADLSAVAMDDAGNFVVTWQTDNDIFMRGFDAKGNETFAQKPVSDNPLSTKGKRSRPDIAMDKDGNFVVVWEDDANADNDYDISARGFKKDGTERIPEFIANKDKSYQQKNPAIGMNRNGTFHIAWEDDRDGNDVFRISMSAWNPDGSVLIEDQLAGSSQKAHDPSVCVADDGTGYFAWAADIFTNGSTKYTNVNLRTTSKSFATQSIAHNAVQGTQDQPAIGCNDAGKYAISWRDDVDGNGAYEVMSIGYN